jgi:hypothetical protein
MGKNLSYLTVLLIANIVSFAVFAQSAPPIKGNIKNSVTGAPVSKASVNIKGEEGLYDHPVGAKGDFSFYTNKAFPFTLVIYSPGYKTKEVVVDSYIVPVKVKLKPTNNDGSVKSKPKSRKKQ